MNRSSLPMDIPASRARADSTRKRDSYKLRDHKLSTAVAWLPETVFFVFLLFVLSALANRHTPPPKEKKIASSPPLPSPSTVSPVTGRLVGGDGGGGDAVALGGSDGVCFRVDHFRAQLCP